MKMTITNQKPPNKTTIAGDGYTNIFPSEPSKQRPRVYVDGNRIHEDSISINSDRNIIKLSSPPRKKSIITIIKPVNF